MSLIKKVKMKKVFFFAIALFTLNSYAQTLYSAENICNGKTVNTMTGEELSNDNTICIEVDLKKSNVEITNFGEVKNYAIGELESGEFEGYYYIYCYSKEYGNIQVMTTDYGISVTYGENLMAFADYPLDVQMKNSDKSDNDPRLDKETGTFR
jgi:hypothetical protein